MILTLTTTGLALASLGGGSILIGHSSDMDSIRAFFLNEQSRIDDILDNSNQMLSDLEINQEFQSNSDFDFKPDSIDEKSENTSAATVLGSVASEGLKAYFNYKYLVVALITGVIVKLLSSDKSDKDRGRI